MLEQYKHIGMFTLPDFGQVQLTSFCRFLDDLLPRQLELFGVIQDSGQELEFRLLGKQYKLAVPLLTEAEAIKQSTTYASELYVPVQIVQKEKGILHTQTVSLGSIPLMTKQGTFIVNGVSRVVVSQIIRRPGIYYGVKSDRTYTATFVSDWGRSFRLEIDPKGRSWVRFNKRSKVSIQIAFLAMGIEVHDIPENLRSHFEDIFEEDKISLPSMEEAMEELSNQIPGAPMSFSINIGRRLQNRLLQWYEIGTVGRCNLNKRLHLDVPENEIFLTAEDLLAASLYLFRLREGLGHLDDIDHLKHKRVCSVADLLGDQLERCLSDLADGLSRRIDRAIRRAGTYRRLPSPKSLLGPTPLAASFKQLFSSHPLYQFLDQTNPLSEMAHKRRISSLGAGGLTTRTASFRVRDIHPSHYGRICPIETSEGMSAGLVASLSTHARVNSYGSIETPLYFVSGICLKEGPVYMVAGEDEYYKIATGNCLAVDEFGQSQQITSGRHRQEFLTTYWGQVHLRSIFPLQNFSVGTSLVPFLEHDDATRALMGSNMHRQAVPLIRPERAIVGTGLEAQIALDSATTLVATHSGKVKYADRNKILIIGTDGVDSVFELAKYKRSNQGTCISHKPIVGLKEGVTRGQLIADGSTTVGGELALGKNVLVAYMPWEGYNFEDAVLISDRLVSDDVYTSIHIERYESEARDTQQGHEKITRQIPHLNSHVLRHLDDTGIVRLGAAVEPGDVLVGKLTPQGLQGAPHVPEARLLQAIFGLESITTRETCLKVPLRGGGRVVEIQRIQQENGTLNPSTLVHVYILQKRRIQVGDKVAGRHGNKGVISRILSRQDMPYLQDGTPVDMVLSPLGVPSRMNVGQIFECLLGMAGNLLDKHYRIPPFDERYEPDSSRKLVFGQLCKARQVTGFSWLFEPDSPGKTRLFDGRTGDPFDQPVTVGRAYVLKLIHQVDNKIHARSTGPYTLVTQQPLRGRSRRGGQRVGEMEVWALEGFGAAHVLQEMLTIKSDHMSARHETLGAIIAGELIPKPFGKTESFRLLVRELRCLGIEVGHTVVSKHSLATSVSQV